MACCPLDMAPSGLVKINATPDVVTPDKMNDGHLRQHSTIRVKISCTTPTGGSLQSSFHEEPLTRHNHPMDS
jgi:hypothetical protein